MIEMYLRDKALSIQDESQGFRIVQDGNDLMIIWQLGQHPSYALRPLIPCILQCDKEEKIWMA